jgi:hypothetical protein
MKITVPFIAIAAILLMIADLKTSESNAQGINKITFVYHFTDKLLDLGSLKYIDTNVTKTYKEIKRENNHADMFSKSPKSNIVFYKNLLFELKENLDITISDSKNKIIKTIKNPDKGIQPENVSVNAVIFSAPTGVVVIVRFSEENGYHIRKYDENGNMQNYWKIQHTIYKKTDNTVESIPWLYYFAHTDNAIIFSSIHYSKPQGTIIQSLTDTSQIRSDLSTGGIIVDPEDNNLAGLIRFSDKTMEVTMEKKSWKKPDEGWGDAAKTVLSDNILVVARYHNIATGCRVNAYDVSSGELLWKGDVKQLNVGHSKYYNVVHLTSYGNKLILEGNEAYGDYLQVLDLKTGKNLFADMPAGNE